MLAVVSVRPLWNGTPPLEILEQILPLTPGDPNRTRFALLSTHDKAYNDVPHPGTLTELGKRCTVRTTLGTPDAEAVIVEFSA